MAKRIVYIIDGCISAMMIVMFALDINQYVLHEPDRFSLLYIGKLYNNWYSPPMVNTSKEGKPGYSYFNYGFYHGLNLGCKCGKDEADYFEGDCTEENCEPIEEESPRNYSVWNETVYQVKSMGLDYLSYLANLPKDNNNNSSDCADGMKNCGLLDTFNNSMCINISEECPANNITYDNYTVILSNNNLTKQKIIVQLYASVGEPCIHPNRINYKGKILKIRKDKDLLGCKEVLNKYTTDTRFQVIEAISLEKFYKDNYCEALSNFEQTHNRGSNDISLYLINYIGLNLACFQKNKKEIQNNNFKKIKILSMISDYQSSKKTYVLFAVFVCCSLLLDTLHWIIILQKNYRLMIKLESQIFSLICLLSFFSSFVYIRFLFNSSILFKINFDCGDNITNDALKDAENVLFAWKMKGLFMFLFGILIGVLVLVRDFLTKDEVLKADYIKFIKTKEEDEAEEEEENDDVDESFADERGSKITVSPNNINE